MQPRWKGLEPKFLIFKHFGCFDTLDVLAVFGHVLKVLDAFVHFLDGYFVPIILGRRMIRALSSLQPLESSQLLSSLAQ